MSATAAPTDAQPTKPYYHFDVKMTCDGCSGAVDRVLKRKAGEGNSYNVDLASQTANVWGPNLPPFEDIKQAIAKTGKEILKAEEIKA